jgi:hypothetical protein
MWGNLDAWDDNEMWVALLDGAHFIEETLYAKLQDRGKIDSIRQEPVERMQAIVIAKSEIVGEYQNIQPLLLGSSRQRLQIQRACAHRAMYVNGCP